MFIHKTHKIGLACGLLGAIMMALTAFRSVWWWVGIIAIVLGLILIIVTKNIRRNK